MKSLIIFTLFCASIAFGLVGFGVLAKSASAIHEILGFMCIGFGVMFIGQIGAMLGNGE